MVDLLETMLDMVFKYVSTTGQGNL